MSRKIIGVTVGTPININGKLDKVEHTGDHSVVYAVSKTNEQTALPTASNARVYTLVIRNSNKTFDIGDPVTDKNPATKAYVDNAIAEAIREALASLKA